VGKLRSLVSQNTLITESSFARRKTTSKNTERHGTLLRPGNKPLSSARSMVGCGLGPISNECTAAGGVVKR